MHDSDLLAGLDIPVQLNVPLAPMTWYGLGGAAQMLAQPESVEQLVALCKRCHKNNVDTYVLGSGANLLVADAGVTGVVVRLDHPSFCQLSIQDDVVTLGSGYDLMKAVLQTAKAGLGGLECLAGIPASIGGAVRMNAGGLHGNIGQSVKRVRVCDQAGQVYDRDRDDLVFEYRKSNILARYILDVDFQLQKQEPAELVKRVKEIFLYKKNAQPMAQSSAGCVYQNPTGLPEDWPADWPKQAGALIDRAGLKGYTAGKASISDKHANFIVTQPGAKSSDVLAIMLHIEKTIQKQFGIALKRELVVWPS